VCVTCEVDGEVYKGVMSLCRRGRWRWWSNGQVSELSQVTVHKRGNLCFRVFIPLCLAASVYLDTMYESPSSRDIE
jgi:hypothetical protein